MSGFYEDGIKWRCNKPNGPIEILRQVAHTSLTKSSLGNNFLNQHLSNMQNLVSEFEKNTSNRVLMTVAGISSSAATVRDNEPNKKFERCVFNVCGITFWPTSKQPKYNATPGTTRSKVCKKPHSSPMNTSCGPVSLMTYTLCNNFPNASKPSYG